MPRIRRLLARLPDLPTVLYTHPFELCLGIVLILVAVRGVLEGVVTPSIDETLPVAPRVAYQAVSAAAGLLIVVGLNVRDRWQPGKAIEQAGLYLGAGAFIGYAIVVAGSLGWVAFVNIGISVAIGVACILRARAIRRAERIKLAVLELANREDEGVA
jgi:hypothetical protein